MRNSRGLLGEAEVQLAEVLGGRVAFLDLGGLPVGRQHLDARRHLPAVASGPVQVSENGGSAGFIGAVEALAELEFHKWLRLA